MSKKKPRDDRAVGPEAPPAYPWQTVAGVFLAAGLALAGLLQFQQATAMPTNLTRDTAQVRLFVDAFSDLRATLPEDEVLGFLSNAAPGDRGGAFLKARYAVAPRLLLDSWQDSKARWVVGVFAAPPDFSALQQRQGLVVSKDYGNGLVLFRREVRR